MNPAPATFPATINDFVNKVKAALQNRSDVNETQTNPDMRPSAWIRDTLRELTASYPFEELRTNGPMVKIGPGLGWQGSNYMYPVSMFLNPGDDMTLMDDPIIFLNSSQATSVGIVATTTNVVAYPMSYLSPKAIQSLLFIPGGVPFRFTRYGNMFWFGSQPGQPYNVYVPYQIRHPFNENLPSTPVRLPQDWWDILSYAAAERGAIAFRWNDQATFLHNILYGDPKYQESGGENGRPGLISARIFQPERDHRLSPVHVMIGAQRY
ncbi:MAG TPA: hypothetical protein VH187_18710 [Scandinavium sp.]|jgi:hypothetical protein|uniref:hypothetical protein n=1 Tax=Scandinavium sp. TaxID=2830653 RepID=UPI002E349E1A|nr:hypothetical protein [Scandinavium sp.]HEX4503170.1 hypothetical protein [Scandinavium sp.]